MTPHESVPSPFDFDSFRAAFVSKNVDTWSSFYADDAEWIEYRHANPPRSPNRMVGKQAIRGFIARIHDSSVVLEVSDEIIGQTRASFRVWCTLGDGRNIIEHCIIHYENGFIVLQVDVEAWDTQQ